MPRHNLPPSMRPERQPVSGMTLETRLSMSAGIVAHHFAYSLKLDRDAIMSRVVRDAQDGFDPAKSKTVLADVDGDHVPVMNAARIFNMVYTEHHRELGDPVDDRNQERCLAIVRRTLEAMPDFLNAGIEQLGNPPDVALL